MEALEQLNEYLQKSSGELPTGEPCSNEPDKKPNANFSRKSFASTKKSQDFIGTPEELSQINAVVASKLRKGEDDMLVGVGVASEKTIKSEYFHSEYSPTLAPPQVIISKSHRCQACGSEHGAMFTACPHCGYGQQKISLLPGQVFGGGGVVLEKSYQGSVLKPVKQEADLYLPNGSQGE